MRVGYGSAWQKERWDERMKKCFGNEWMIKYEDDDDSTIQPHTHAIENKP